MNAAAQAVDRAGLPKNVKKCIGLHSGLIACECTPGRSVPLSVHCPNHALTINKHNTNWNIIGSCHFGWPIQAFFGLSGASAGCTAKPAADTSRRLQSLNCSGKPGGPHPPSFGECGVSPCCNGHPVYLQFDGWEYWWRRGELNPCPKTLKARSLHAYSIQAVVINHNVRPLR